MLWWVTAWRSWCGRRIVEVRLLSARWRLGGRARAAVDREQAARDRKQAAGDRVQAQADRDALLDQLAAAKSDGLTGGRSRAMGLGDFDHAIDRAHGALARLVIACVDVAWDPNAPSCPQACK
jgi:hypothetical protein